MNISLPGPIEAWDEAEQEIDFWQEEKDRKRRAYWRAVR